MTLAIKNGLGVDKQLATSGAETALMTHHVISDVLGETVGVHGGALNVHSIDVHNIPINTLVHKHTGTTSTIAITANADDTSVTLVDASSFSIGQRIAIDESFFTLTDVVGNVVTLDARLDAGFSIGTEVELVITDMADVGSLASPLIYVVEPPAGVIWHITRILFTMTHSVPGDLEGFGGIDPIENGLSMRTKVGGVSNSFINWKDNEDIKTCIYDLEFTDKAKRIGDTFGTSGRYTFSKLGVAVKLDGSTGDALQILIQDDLSGLGSFHMNAQGHIA